MGWIPVNWHDVLLQRIANSNMQVVLAELPNSYKEAYWPKAEWRKNTAYGVGDLVTAPLPGGYGEQVLQTVFFIYECITAGTSGNNEPTFPTQVGNQLTEGGVTWTTHRNTVLASADMVATDFNIEDITTTPIDQFTNTANRPIGRKLIVGEKTNNLIYRNGQANWVALINTTDSTITHITQATVPTMGNTSGSGSSGGDSGSSGGGTNSTVYTLINGNKTTMYSYAIEHRVVWP